MAIFDEHIRKLFEYVEGRRGAGRRIREKCRSVSVRDLVEELPIRVGPGASPGIILRSDAAIELGNPEEGSSALLLWTADPSMVKDGRITLIGPDIPESPGMSLPFGQVLIIGGKGLNTEKHEVLLGTQHISDQIEGYMVKISPTNVWGRVSHGAMAKGFSFEILGKALMGIFKSSIPEIEAVEVVFVTSSQEDVRLLEVIAAEVDGIGRKMVNELWKVKGYDIKCDYNCRVCTYKAVCDEVRYVIALRESQA